MHSFNEKCAVVGIYNTKDAARLAYLSLFAMQHRGQEASGISSSYNSSIITVKNKGLVADVFNSDNLALLKGNIAIGHNRYSTAGEESLPNIQPLFSQYNLGEIAIVHNGNLTNAKELRKKLIQEGSIFSGLVDTENIIHLIAKSKENKLQDKIIDALSYIQGAYSLIILSRNKMFAIRDKYGFRPLSIGKISNKDGSFGYIVSSESCAFDIIGAKFVRDVAPGEMIVFGKDYSKYKSISIFKPTPKPCVFEYVYFARPDSKVFGQDVYKIRKNMGYELASEAPVNADMVVPVPDSGIIAALGYAKKSKIPFEMGIVRSHYVGRTFIEPSQKNREIKVRLKLAPIRSVIEGKSIIVIDDSIVRGTTSRQIVRLLKSCGAKYVHMRISSPPTISPCFYGVDTPAKEELISSTKTLEEVRDYIEADSLAFLSLEALNRSVNKVDDYCQACFDKQYAY